MNYPVRVALIGCGLIGQKRLKNLPPGSVTVACDVDLGRAKALAAQSPGCVATGSVAEAVASSSVGAVMIGTVNASLAPIACQAVQAGKHVLVEKPVGISLRELEQLEELHTRPINRLYRWLLEGRAPRHKPTVAGRA